MMQQREPPNDSPSSNRAELPVDAGLPSRRIASEALFGSMREVGIVHDGQLYRLRITRAGKLILVK